jgi:hypothetical protein
MICPDRDELIVFREHELGERRAGELRAHVASCPACRDRLAALARLVGDLRAPIAPPGPLAVAHVMRRLDAQRRPANRAWPRLGLAIAAAAVVGVVVMVRPTPGGSGDGTLTARGGGGSLTPDHVTAQAIEREVGTQLFAVGARAELLPAGAQVSPSTAFVIGYRNLSRSVSLFALVFAVDSAHEVHWLYPGFTVAGDDPAAVALAASDTMRLMPETVVLDGVAAGPLRVIAVISAERLRVSAIEQLRGDELTAAALARRYPAAAVTEQRLEVSP